MASYWMTSSARSSTDWGIDRHVLALDEPLVDQALTERRHEIHVQRGRRAPEKPDHWPCRLLRVGAAGQRKDTEGEKERDSELHRTNL
jgi:hypothetical protein